MKDLDLEEAFYSFTVKPLALTIQELREYGVSEVAIWEGLRFAFEAGIRKFNREQERRDAGH
jgi:hypothetical protein